MSTAFIKTDLEKWDLAENFDNYDSKDHGVPRYDNPVPIISCIGSSRDGKSTLLNCLHKYICRKIPDFSFEHHPFKARNGDDMVTNGIDFVSIPDKAILIDCQGMALKYAKYDHYLTLIVYLISDIIILNVRQRLDLQVLNNLLAVFSFLSEIPLEHRRMNKPTLIIRIKDFQDFEKLEQKPNYLKAYVKKWLKKSGDQYDQIKEAFEMAFNIDIIYTEYPRFPPRSSKLNMYSKDFEKDNLSFLSACEHIIDTAESMELCENRLLTDPTAMRELISSLKTNKNIDFRKLDLYHNITQVDLLKYKDSTIKILPFIDRTLIDQMDGSLEAATKYTERQEQIDVLYEDTYNKKFKDVTKDLKDELFFDQFCELYQIVTDAKTRNIEIATNLIKPHLDTFGEKYGESAPFQQLVSGILEIFDEKKKILIEELDKIDPDVKQSVINELNTEEKALKLKQKKITKLNDKNLKDLKCEIKEYNPDDKYNQYVQNDVDSQFTNEQYNVTSETTYAKVSAQISNELNDLYNKYRKTYYLDKTKDIQTKAILDFQVTSYIPSENSQYFYGLKFQKFTQLGFLRSVSHQTNKIDMIEIHWDRSGVSLTMTIMAFMKFINLLCVKEYFKKYGFMYNDAKKVNSDIISKFNAQKSDAHDSLTKFIEQNPKIYSFDIQSKISPSAEPELFTMLNVELFKCAVEFAGLKNNEQVKIQVNGR